MKSKALKKFIREFDFKNPNWDQLPVGFPDYERGGLTKVEKHYLEAIELAWLTTTKVGRRSVYRKITRASILTIAVIVIGVFAQFVLRNPESTYSTSVNAATISARLKQNFEGVIESTMSAVYKRK